MALTLLISAPVAAQAGPFIDWVFKLSGPEFGVRLPTSLRLTAGHQRGIRLDMNELSRYVTVLTEFRRHSSDTTGPAARCAGTAAATFGQLSTDTAYRAQLVHRIRKSRNEIAEINALVRSGNKGINDRDVQATALKHMCRIANDVADLADNPRAVDATGLIVHLNNIWAEETGIEMRSHQLTLEYLLPPLTITVANLTVPFYFGAEFGIALHHFDVPDGDEFYHWSTPILLNWHAFPASKWFAPFRAGVGYHVFRPFDADAFDPLEPIEPSGVIEFVPTLFLEYDLLALVCSSGLFCF